VRELRLLVLSVLIGLGAWFLPAIAKSQVGGGGSTKPVCGQVVNPNIFVHFDCCKDHVNVDVGTVCGPINHDYHYYKDVPATQYEGGVIYKMHKPWTLAGCCGAGPWDVVVAACEEDPQNTCRL
jgi:hypothetical protein